MHERILEFPDGYDTVVGERGLRLSGGEKQRIAIARTLLKNPKVVVYDEATSSLDAATEVSFVTRLHQVMTRRVQASITAELDAAAEGRTMLTIAHRLSSVVKCDQICVLAEGVVAERGSHAELLKMNGRYASLWNQQHGSSENPDGSQSQESSEASAS